MKRASRSRRLSWLRARLTSQHLMLNLPAELLQLQQRLRPQQLPHSQRRRRPARWRVPGEPRPRPAHQWPMLRLRRPFARRRLPRLPRQSELLLQRPPCQRPRPPRPQPLRRRPQRIRPQLPANLSTGAGWEGVRRQCRKHLRRKHLRRPLPPPHSLSFRLQGPAGPKATSAASQRPSATNRPNYP